MNTENISSLEQVPGAINQIFKRLDELQTQLNSKPTPKPAVIPTDELLARKQAAAALKVEQFLDTLLPGNWDEMPVYERRNWLKGTNELQPKGTMIRTKVSAPEIYCECLGGNQKDITPILARDIHLIMRNMKNWTEGGQMSFKHYGRVKGHTRTNTAEMEKQKFSEFQDDYLITKE